MKKKIIYCFILTYLLESFCFSVYAYRPSPFLSIETTPNDLPQNTAYIDLLLPIQESDENFVLQKDEIDTVYNIFDYSYLQLSDTCEIANYNNGCYSYYFHFNNSTISVFSFENDNHIYIHYGEEQRLLEDYLRKIDSFKLAFVDEQGCIIKVSNSISVQSSLSKSFSNLKIVNGEVSEVYMELPYSRMLIFSCLPCIIVISILMIRKFRKHSSVLQMFSYR